MVQHCKLQHACSAISISIYAFMYIESGPNFGLRKEKKKEAQFIVCIYWRCTVPTIVNTNNNDLYILIKLSKIQILTLNMK